LQSLCNVGAEDDDGQKAVEQPKKKVEQAPLAEEVIESLHAEYMILWAAYRDLTSDKQAGPYHPENWTARTIKSYQAAIKSINEKIKQEASKSTV
jgi:hypothetical protein